MHDGLSGALVHAETGIDAATRQGFIDWFLGEMGARVDWHLAVDPQPRGTPLTVAPGHGNEVGVRGGDPNPKGIIVSQRDLQLAPVPTAFDVTCWVRNDYFTDLTSLGYLVRFGADPLLQSVSLGAAPAGFNAINAGTVAAPLWTYVPTSTNHLAFGDTAFLTLHCTATGLPGPAQLEFAITCDQCDPIYVCSPLLSVNP